MSSNHVAGCPTSAAREAQRPDGGREVKAWHVTDTHGDADLLVFAATRNRARQMAFDNGTWEYDCYIDIRAIRAPRWDRLFDCEKVIDTNDDLPPGTEPFYSNEEFA